MRPIGCCLCRCFRCRVASWCARRGAFEEGGTPSDCSIGRCCGPSTGWAVGLVWFNPTFSARAEGTVVSIRTTAQNSECCPVTVEFTDHFGTAHTFSSPSGGNRQQQVGDSIRVYYSSDDPSQAQTADGRITPLAVGGFGVFVLAMIAVMFLMGSRRERRSETP